MSSLLVMVGLTREARIVRGGARVLIGGHGLEPALAERPAAFLSFGLCGALDPALRIGDLVLGESVTTTSGVYLADAAWSAELAKAAPRALLARVAAGPRMLTSPHEKAHLRAQTGAAAVDMESHLVAEAAARLGVPFAVLRSVSDRADHAISGAAQAGFKPDGAPDLAGVLTALLAKPFEFPALIRTAIHAATAFKALDLCGKALDWRAPAPAPAALAA